MNALSIPSDLQKKILEDKERIVITSPDGKPIAALIPLEDLDSLQELEDQRDADEFRKAKEEAAIEGYVSLDTVLTENGLKRKHPCTKSKSPILREK